jgi:hypothetical protein
MQHQSLVKNAEAAKHTSGFTGSERIQQVDDMGRKFLRFGHAVISC